MYQSLLEDSRLFDLLLRLDEDLASEVRQEGCACGGVLHRADYERKPRGGPPGLSPGQVRRRSFCCAVEGCRRRRTPASLRFLGRRVFFAVVVVLVPALRDGLTAERLTRLRSRLGVSARTVRRWCRFWRETFMTSRAWLTIAGRLARALPAEGMPGALIEAFAEITDSSTRVIAVLQLISDTGAGCAV